MVGLSLREISHVIALSTAPAFLLGGIVAFLALLMARMNGLVDRMRLIDDIDEGDQRRARHKSDLPSLRRRAKLIHQSISLSVLSAGTTAFLVLIAFVGALLNLQLESLIAVLFVFGLFVFMMALCLFVLEAFIALKEIDRKP
jgi:hypothetical protein